MIYCPLRVFFLLILFLLNGTINAQLKVVMNQQELDALLNSYKTVVLLIKNGNQSLITQEFYRIEQRKLIKNFTGIFAEFKPTDAQFIKLNEKYGASKRPALLVFNNGKIVSNPKGMPLIIYVARSKAQVRHALMSLIQDCVVQPLRFASPRRIEDKPKNWVHTPASLYFSGGYEGPFWDDYNPYWYSPYAFYPWAYSYPYEYGYPVRGSFGINFSF